MKDYNQIMQEYGIKSETAISDFNHMLSIDETRLTKKLNLCDRCKCEKCQKEVRFVQDILDYRSYKNKQKDNKAEPLGDRERAKRSDAEMQSGAPTSMET